MDRQASTVWAISMCTEGEGEGGIPLIIRGSGVTSYMLGGP